MPEEKIDFNASLQFTLSIGFSQCQSHTTSVSDLIGCDKEEWDFLTARAQEEELQDCLFHWQNNCIESN